MKKTLTLLFTVFSTYVFAQDSLKTFNNSRSQITKTGMEVLGSWGIANMGIGAAGWANSRGGENKYFYQMNLIWGAANFGIAALGFTNTERHKNDALNPAETLRAQQKIENTFLINGGLDLVYIGAGAYLKHRGDTHNSAELKGYGTSVILQGAFLLLFDATMYTSEKITGIDYEGSSRKIRLLLMASPSA